MSSDLLEEFGSLEENPWCGVASQSLTNRGPADEDEDDFGDFEIPEHENVAENHRTSSPSSNGVRYPMGSEYSGNRRLSIDKGYVQSSIHPSGPEVQDPSSNDDDWGDFSKQSIVLDADVEAIRQKSDAGRGSVDERGPEEPTNILLHLPNSTKAFTPKSPARTTNTINGSQVSQSLVNNRPRSSKSCFNPRVKAANGTNTEQSAFADEPWVDFEEIEAVNSGPLPSNAPPLRKFDTAKASNLGPPPSNIPPPSILLPMIATILKSLTTNLKTVTSRQSLDQPSTLSHLRASLSTIRAAARILAGRRLRWKRDNLLSQSMKIGPAHSGKAGGMKLAGVDKAESRREDQEAAETLQVWKQQAGPLRSTVATLNGQLPGMERFKIPEIVDNMLIRQGKPSEGMMTAPKCCFLCGVKRDERVANIDVDVEDSFGEWWVEHWGHVDCVAFWENHKDLLRQR